VESNCCVGVVGGITRHSLTLFGVTVVRTFIIGDEQSCPTVDVGAKSRLIGSSLSKLIQRSI
jgi:hypothetical protein